MSGTSADGIDGVILKIANSDEFEIVTTYSQSFSDKIKKRIRKISSLKISSADESEDLDDELARHYSEAALQLMQKGQLSPDQIFAAGCHGQTIHHNPDGDPAYSLQLGNGQLLADLTGLNIVGNFRAADIEAGGQGAPLAPAFHQAICRNHPGNIAVANIGGISNVTYLPHNQDAEISPDTTDNKVIGFDTGPGNTLIDYWCRSFFKKEYDDKGEIARTGHLQIDLLHQMLKDPYFHRPPPKSTGLEYFSIHWLKDQIANWEGMGHCTHEDILATITVLTARCIVDQLKLLQPPMDALYLCGGGAKNDFLVEVIKDLCAATVHTTEKLGVEPQWIEAAAFGWMAYRTMHKLTSTLPSVTGANTATVAGNIFSPNED